MARNLRSKIPCSDRLVVFDVNQSVMNQLAKEARQDAQTAGIQVDARHVEIATSVRDVAEKAVCTHDRIFYQNKTFAD